MGRLGPATLEHGNVRRLLDEPCLGEAPPPPLGVGTEQFRDLSVPCTNCWFLPSHAALRGGAYPPRWTVRLVHGRTQGGDPRDGDWRGRPHPGMTAPTKPPTAPAPHHCPRKVGPNPWRLREPTTVTPDCRAQAPCAADLGLAYPPYPPIGSGTFLGLPCRRLHALLATATTAWPGHDPHLPPPGLDLFPLPRGDPCQIHPEKAHSMHTHVFRAALAGAVVFGLVSAPPQTQAAA